MLVDADWHQDDFLPYPLVFHSATVGMGVSEIGRLEQSESVTVTPRELQFIKT